MRVIKPISLGITTRSYPLDDRKFLAISALAGFHLRRPLPLMPEIDVLPIMMETLAGQIWDVGMPKVMGEVVLAGKAMAPGGEPVSAMEVGLSIAGVEKRLRVSGDRVWQRTQDGYTFTRPAPFTEMPLGWQSAFGGPGVPENPSGKGYGGRALIAQGELAPLANVEDPRLMVLSINDVPRPAGFGLVDQTVPARQRLMGTYDDHWYRTRFPGFAADIDWRFFNAAPPDQWIQGFFEGDQPFTITGCHAEHPTIHGSLPPIRVRAFVYQDLPATEGGGRRLLEVSMRPETVLLFPNDLMGAVLFRGALEVAGSDAEDVSDVMLAYEKSADAPRGIDHYTDVHAKRTDPKDGWMYAMMQSQLSPVVTEEEKAAREALRAQEEAERTQQAQERIEFVLDGLREDHGVSVPAGIEIPDAQPIPVPFPTKDDIANLDIDFPAIMAAVDSIKADAEKQIAEAKATAEEEQKRAEAELEQRRAMIEEQLGHSTDENPEKIEKQKAEVRAKAMDGALPFGLSEELDADTILGRIDEGMARREEGAEAADPGAAPAGPKLPDDAGDALAKGAAELGQSVDFDLNAVLDEVIGANAASEPLDWNDAAAAELRGQVVDGAAQVREAMVTARLMAPEPVFPDEPLEPEVARYLGDLVREHLAQGMSFAGRDLAGADLKGADLSGLDLAGVMLETADLSGANLAGANLEKAVLTGANLEGANLAGVNLAGGNLGAVRAKDAIFAGADLTDCMMMKGDFTGANLPDTRLGKANALEASFEGAILDRSTAKSVKFIRVKFAGLKARGVRWKHAMMLELDLAGADFSDAELDKVVVYQGQGDGLILDRARLLGFSALASSFKGLRAIGCRNEADGTGFRGCDLTGADFRNSVLGQIELSEADLTDARFAGASLRGAMMFSTNLTGADFTGADLLEAKLRKATCIETCFRGASLYKAETMEAVFGNTVVENANLLGTRLV